ncbi:DUF2238 domain-containing protein [Candidatus Saccharibacteria bacterium]|nr:DUF2238 domain-containing protein [Candidatus Saccharibacteria bacterium]
MKSIIKFLKIIIFFTGASMAIAYFIPNNGCPKIWSYLATMALPFAIDFLRLIGLKISKRLEIAYLLFIIAAMVVGIDFDLYKTVAPYDKIVHTLSGVLTAFGARELLEQASGKPDQIWFKALFSLGFVALVAVLWECYEFSYDQITGGNMQQLISPGLEDTMYDMIVALIGGIVGTVMAFPLRQGSRKK